MTAEEFPNGVNGATSADLIGFLNCSDKDAIDQTGFASKIQKPGPGEQGGRLFVFFAGHGVVAPMSGGYFLDAIVPPDYGKPVVPMIACDWIVRNLRTLPIARQVIIFDCCRNVFKNAKILRLEETPSQAKGVFQNVIYSTRQCYRAADVNTFLQALIDRVKPDSPAGEFQPGALEIHLDRLYEGIKKLFEERMRKAGLGELSSDSNYQIPDYACPMGEPCDGRMLVAKFPPPANLSPKVELRFLFGPPNALEKAELVISEPGKPPLRFQHVDLITQPLSLTLPRAAYDLTMTSPGFGTWSQTTDLRPAEVTGPIDYHIFLKSTPAAAANFPEFAGPQRDGTLVLKSSEWLRPFVLRQLDGRMVSQKARAVERPGGATDWVIENLPPDIYKLELQAPDRVLEEKLVAVGSGDTVVARLDAGAPGEPTSPLAAKSGRPGASRTSRSRNTAPPVRKILRPWCPLP